MVKYVSYLIIFSLFSCQSVNQKFNDDEMTYVYFDKNNNSYKVTKTQLQYTPMTPKESSSGSYDGGIAKIISLSASEYRTLSSYFESLKLQKETHHLERSRMTSLLKITSKTEQQQFILSQSDTLKQLENFLQELLK